jgi:hypothetical protein
MNARKHIPSPPPPDAIVANEAEAVANPISSFSMTPTPLLDSRPLIKARAFQFHGVACNALPRCLLLLPLQLTDAPPPFMDTAIVVLAMVDMAAAANGPHECAALLVIAVVSIGNDANVPLVLLPLLPPTTSLVL